MADDSKPLKQLQFAPFSSGLDTGFWYQLSDKKLNDYGLDDSSKSLLGYYTNGDAVGLSCRLNLDYNAFSLTEKIPPRCYPACGALKNTNTIDEFKTCDKKLIMEKLGQKLWSDITSGQALKEPSSLVSFNLLTFADLKKYHFYYWFAFPALSIPDICLTAPTQLIGTRFTSEQINNLVSEYDKNCIEQQRDFFILQECGEGKMSVHSLSSMEQIIQQSQKWLLCFCDPCTLENHPGWPLRNLLALLAHHWGEQLSEIEVLCLRDRFREGERSVAHSIVLTITLPSKRITECPQCVGWEKNERQKLGPRLVDLSSSMDPARLAESAVDLNLKLMRWRLMPDLDLDAISSTRCLLLGSGTLGCNVARALLGWGVRNITLVDNSHVSYSNPVRQSLFTFEDSINGGKMKAKAAADALRKIFPGVNAQDINLSIPMPGHSIAESLIEKTQSEVKQLEELIESHDAVFLLLDTREARWLPTLIAAAKRKIVINAALGFDTFLVMRHGVRKAGDKASAVEQSSASASYRGHNIPGDLLGCYFCSDVVAPGNSTRDRTLDQQCTVSRPGVSMLASSLAVELLVSVIVHTQGGGATADTRTSDDHSHGEGTDSPLGIVPHQIRGFLSIFHHVMPASQSFDKCTACSQMVLNHYQTAGFSFLLKAFNDPKYLEDLTGLTELHQQTLDDEVWELSDDESSCSMET